MCKTKDEANTKMDRLIASMDRLSTALEARHNSSSPEISDLIKDTVSRGLRDGIGAESFGGFRIGDMPPLEVHIDRGGADLIGPDEG